MSKDRSNDEGFKEELRESEVLGDLMEQRGIKMIPMAKIQEGLMKLQHTSTNVESKREWADESEGENDEDKGVTQKRDDEDLADLLDEKTPVMPSSDVFEKPANKRDLSSIKHEEGSEEEEQNYAESFASQRETSQLREEMEQMSEEMKSLKATLSGILKEREALPGHLSTIREDINQQMTLMLRKLHSALESDVSTSNVQAASATITQARDQATDRLAAASDYANDRPRDNSPLATKGAELKGKRRFRPVK